MNTSWKGLIQISALPKRLTSAENAEAMCGSFQFRALHFIAHHPAHHCRHAVSGEVVELAGMGIKDLVCPPKISPS